MLQHLKWWFKPEQMIWQGPGDVQGGTKIRQNQSKSMVLTRLKIRIGEGVKRNGIIIYWHRDSLTERHIDECKVCCNVTWTYQHKDGQTSHRRIINHYNQHFAFFWEGTKTVCSTSQRIRLLWSLLYPKLTSGLKRKLYTSKNESIICQRKI